jgi:hypothetical protein
MFGPYGNNPISLLIEAVKQNNHEYVAKIIADYPNINRNPRPENSSMTVMHIAAEQGNVQVMAALTKNIKGEALSAMCEAIGPGYWTPLHYAVCDGHHLAVNWLLGQTWDIRANYLNPASSGIDPNPYGRSEDNSKGITPLFLAAEKGYTGIAQSLLAMVDVEAIHEALVIDCKDGSSRKISPLDTAIERDQVKIVSLFRAYQVDIAAYEKWNEYFEKHGVLAVLEFLDNQASSDALKICGKAVLQKIIVENCILGNQIPDLLLPSEKVASRNLLRSLLNIPNANEMLDELEISISHAMNAWNIGQNPDNGHWYLLKSLLENRVFSQELTKEEIEAAVEGIKVDIRYDALALFDDTFPEDITLVTSKDPDKDAELEMSPIMRSATSVTGSSFK